MSASIECILGATSWQQAQAIADGLLAKGLADSVEFMEVKAEQWRRHTDENVHSIKLIITTTTKQQSAIRRFAATVKNERKKILELPDMHIQTNLKQWLGTVVAGRILLTS